ncbi:MAG: biopolymer transporter ExbD [Fibrobacter sp.]|nr:biopolymer transporter ExbD [Fibrobacter sp.]
MSFFRYGEECDQGSFRPQLTSLIDVMTILLVFLIRNFSDDQNVVSLPQGTNLPHSTSQQHPHFEAYTLDITKDAVICKDTVIVSLEQVKNSDLLLVEPLYTWLKKEHANMDSTENVKLLIQCDKDVLFSYVKKVMYSCSRAGFFEFSVLVIREDL